MYETHMMSRNDASNSARVFPVTAKVVTESGETQCVESRGV